MTPAATAREFVSAPVGRYVTGQTWLACCPRTGLSGFVLWGSPSEADARAFVDVLPEPGVPFADRMARFVDVRHLETPEPAAFAVFAGRVRQHRGYLPGIVTRAAILRGTGLAGAVAEGFAKVVPTPFPIAFFTEQEAALAWLAVEQDPSIFDELDELRERAARDPSLLRELRRVLGANVRDATLAKTAAALGLSTRSLQRRLQEQSVAFQDELQRARVERAQALLLETDATVAEVGREVGCASAHHFAALFRKATGRTPARWRDEQRSG